MKVSHFGSLVVLFREIPMADWVHNFLNFLVTDLGLVIIALVLLACTFIWGLVTPEIVDEIEEE